MEPDICDTIAARDDEQKLEKLVIVPIGFVSDHMEVMYDLDDEAKQVCDERGIAMSRAATAGVRSEVIAMVRKLVEERMGIREQKDAIGDLGPWHDVCPKDCCQYTPRRPVARPAT